MRRPARDSWLAIGLLIALVLLTIAAAVYQAKEQAAQPALASFSSAPNGARALRLWLEELGYAVSDQAGPAFRPPESTGVILMLEPLPGIAESEWETIDGWVEEGGTLVLAGESWGSLLAAHHYEFEMAYLPQGALTLTIQAPLLTSPLLTTTVKAHARSYFKTDRDDFATHLAVGSNPVMLSFELGTGRVILSAAPFPFSNAGLKEEGNPQLVLNLIAASAQEGTIWFDEWHHGLQAQQVAVGGPGDWLRHTPAGRSLLYTAAVIFLGLVLQGRRFGRPVPLRKQTARRAPLEYITAVANLSRRAGHRHAVLQYHRHLLKRDLGKRYRLNPTLPDDEYVARLAELNPKLDAAALGRLLARLRRSRMSESELIQWAGEAADWLKE